MYCLYRLTTCWHQTEELSQTQNWAPLNLAELPQGHRALPTACARSWTAQLENPRPRGECVYFQNAVFIWEGERQERIREMFLVQRSVLWKIEVILKPEKGAVALVGNNKRVWFMERHLVHSWHFLQMKRKADMDCCKTVDWQYKVEKKKNVKKQTRTQVCTRRDNAESNDNSCNAKNP